MDRRTRSRERKRSNYQSHCWEINKKGRVGEEVSGHKFIGKERVKVGKRKSSKGEKKMEDCKGKALPKLQNGILDSNEMVSCK